jgi:hypothetical protein
MSARPSGNLRCSAGPPGPTYWPPRTVGSVEARSVGRAPILELWDASEASILDTMRIQPGELRNSPVRELPGWAATAMVLARWAEGLR